MKIYMIILWLYILLFSLLAGCNTTPTNDIKDTENNQLPNDQPLIFFPSPAFVDRIDDYCARGLADNIRDSDFCVLGKVNIRKTGNTTAHGTNAYVTEGEIEVNAIVYGEPGANSIPFSMVRLLFGDGHETEDVWIHSNPNEGDTVIIMGKGHDKNIAVTHSFKPGSIDEMQSYFGEVRTIRNIEKLPDAERQVQREKLLETSNNTGVLIYLFTHGFKEGGLSWQIDIIDAIFRKGKITPERKFLACCLATHIFYPPPRVLGGNYKPIPYSRYKYYQEIKPDEKQRLKDLVKEGFSGANTVKEGLNYLTGLMPFILVKGDLLFKNDLEKIAGDLSKKFAKDKDYSEWKEAVKQLFSYEDMLNKKGK